MSQRKEVEKPFSFKDLPLFLQQNSIEKFSFEDFVIFSHCSRSTASACESRRFSLPFPVFSVNVSQRNVHVRIREEEEEEDAINWRILSKSSAKILAQNIIINCELSTKRQEKLLRELKNRCLAENLVLKGKLGCGPEKLAQLIEQLKTKGFESTHFVEEGYLPIFENMSSLKIFRCAMSEKQFSAYKMAHFECISDNISDESINRILREWLEGRRMIDRISIGWSHSREARNLDEIFLGIQANPIWTNEGYEENLAVLHHTDHRGLFSIWNPVRIQENLVICFERKKISIFRSSEMDALSEILSSYARFHINE